MSMTYMDSWDGYTTAEIQNYWPTLDSFPGFINTSIPRTGTGCLQPAVSGQFRSLPNTETTVVVGVAYNPSVLGSTVLQFRQLGITGSIQVSLSVSFDALLYIRRGFSGPVIGVSDPRFPLINSIYNYIEWKTGFTHSSYNEIRVNGQVVFTGTLDCQNTAIPGADTVGVFGIAGGSVAVYDDFYLLVPDGNGDTDFQGDSGVIFSGPTSEGVFIEWTPGGPGAQPQHYKNVAEIPCDFDNSYNASNGSGTRDTYLVTPNLLTTDQIKGVQLTELVHDIDNDGLSARPYINILGTPYSNPADNYVVPSTYLPPQLKQYDVDPITSVAWTPARFNVTSWGIRQV
jgi:hypothetical protein